MAHPIRLPDDFDPLLAKAATLDSFALAKLPDGSVIIENPLALTQLQFTPDQWRRAVEFIDHPTPDILEEET